MRVCDKHPAKPAVESMSLSSTDSHFDLCEECAGKVREFMAKPKQEDVQPKRRSLLGLGKKD
jgi:hypothetical protein